MVTVRRSGCSTRSWVGVAEQVISYLPTAPLKLGGCPTIGGSSGSPSPPRPGPLRKTASTAPPTPMVHLHAVLIAPPTYVPTSVLRKPFPWPAVILHILPTLSRHHDRGGGWTTDR